MGVAYLYFLVRRKVSVSTLLFPLFMDFFLSKVSAMHSSTKKIINYQDRLDHEVANSTFTVIHILYKPSKGKCKPLIVYFQT